jgi:purine-nucleoside phosphorylase
MNKIPTPHIEATSPDEVAKIVLMPGDPLRAKKIAETYLQDATQFNQVRGMLGFTGAYKGKKLSVMGSGMGFGSIGIYAYELYKFYDVDVIIRIGSCGASIPDLEIMDIILAEKSFSTETFAKDAYGISDNVIEGSPRVFEAIQQTASSLGTEIHPGIIGSGNVFYSTVKGEWEENERVHDVIAGEMESFALFATAKALNKEAACMLTVSDSKFKKDQNLSAEARQNAFDDMMRLALDTAVQLAD